MASFLSIISSLLVGVVLLVSPWLSLWETNYLLPPQTVMRSFLLSAFTRGAISGLGLVNILLALHDARQSLSEPGEGS